MRTKKIISISVALSLLISLFFLILRFRCFTNERLKGHIEDMSAIALQYVNEETGLGFVSSMENKTDAPAYPFIAGEKLRYFIYSARIKVGEVNITYLGKRDLDGVLRDVVLLEARAPGFIDSEEIYGDIESFTPVRVERRIRLFGEDINISERYNENTNEVLIVRKARNTTVQRIISEGKISNIILLLYHFRYKDKEYNIGEKLGFNLPTQKLEMLIDKETMIRVPKGEFKAVFVKSEPSRFKVWLRSDDRIPLRIQGAIGFGSTYLDLKEID